jgi:hypothetical protein
MKAYGAYGFTLGDEDIRRKVISIKRSKTWRRDINAYLRGKARMQAKQELRKTQEEQIV